MTLFLNYVPFRFFLHVVLSRGTECANECMGEEEVGVARGSEGRGKGRGRGRGKGKEWRVRGVESRLAWNL